MRASLVVEPAVLAMPALSTDEQSIAQSIETIIELSEAAREADFNVCILSEAENYLAEAGLYPVSHSIAQSLASCGLSHVYTTEDIRRSIQSILHRARRLEEISGIDFLIPNNMQTKPDVLSSREISGIRESLEVTLAHTALLSSTAGKRNVQALLIPGEAFSSEIEILAEITDIAPSFKGSADQQELSCTIGLVESASSFGDQLDASEVWRIAENETEMSIAIAIKARSVRTMSGCPAPRENCDKFHLSAAFVDTMLTSQTMPNARYGTATFECLARLVARSPSEAPSKLYKLSETGRREDVVRSDGAVGWRLHVTKSGEAIRLMFWRRNDASIEFASLGPKGQVRID